MATPIVEAKGLVKRFGDFTAVNGIDFTVEAGECYGLLGPNGAGKTSTFRMVCCVSPVTEGVLLVNGKDVGKDARTIKETLGVVPQDSNLDTDLEVLQNLLVYARYFDMPAKVARARAMEVLEFFQLADRASSNVEALSGGMKRRLTIARALLNNPKLLVLDEPTTGLDPQARHLIWQKVRTLKAQGVTVLLSTHYMEEAAQLCDRLSILHEGKILTEGKPAELVQEVAGSQVLEVGMYGDDASRVTDWLDGEERFVQEVGDRLFVFGSELEPFKQRVLAEQLSLTQRPATLEDVFLRLTGSGLRE